jgi:hypothetical protein
MPALEFVESKVQDKGVEILTESKFTYPLDKT